MGPLNRIDADSNAFSFSFDEKILSELQNTYESQILPLLAAPEYACLFVGGETRRGSIGQDDHQYYYATYDQEPLFWLSNNNQHTYDLFKRFYQALDIVDGVKRLVDFDEDIALYSGFLVVSDRAHQHAWHNDYAPDANAYTLITPLFEPDKTHGNLMYQDSRNDIQTYPYKYGEAVIFGDYFPHSTEPYPKSDTPRILVSLTFGTDKLEHWPALKQTVGGQSDFMILPCGHQRGSCKCLDSL